MMLSIRTLDRVAIVNVRGAVDSHAAGQLSDTLVSCASEGRTLLIADLSDVHVMTRAGVRGLVVAAKLMKHGGGEMRICGAQPQVEAFLLNLGFNHLIQCDPTLQSSLARLCDGQTRETRASPSVASYAEPSFSALAPAPAAHRVGARVA